MSDELPASDVSASETSMTRRSEQMPGATRPEQVPGADAAAGAGMNLVRSQTLVGDLRLATVPLAPQLPD